MSREVHVRFWESVGLRCPAPLTFLFCSYGFRPGRSAHEALRALRTGFMEQGLRWVVDVDIARYFDTIDHAHLRGFLDQRVTDGVVRRMIDKWLKAGVLDKGILRRTTGGTPQGGVISPLLSNISCATCWTNGSRGWRGHA